MSKLINNYLPELRSLFRRWKRPSMVTINLTRRCNQKCVYCEIGILSQPDKKDRLTLADLKWLLDQMSIYKIQRISLCGGEPFLFDGIIDIIEYAGKKEIRCSITSNGMTVHKLTEKELNTLKKFNTEINISVDSFNENIQTFTRGNSLSLQNALKSIKKLLENNIPVTVLTAISKYNFKDLLNHTTKVYELGVKQVLFQPIIYYSNYPDQKTIDNKSNLNVDIDNIDVLKNELKMILKFEKVHKINTNVYRIIPWIEHYIKTAYNLNGKWFFNNVLNKFFCREIYAIIDISYDGEIQPCCLSKATINIFDERNLGLLELWSKATLKIKDDMINGRFYNHCNGCCNHFSRNMLASLMKYPFQNRATLLKMIPLLSSRAFSRIYKNLFINY